MQRGTAVRPAGAPMVPMPSGTTGPGGGIPADDGRAAQAASQVVQAASRAGGEMAHELTDAMRGEVGRRSTEAGDRVHGIAGDLHSVARHLRDEGRDTPAGWIDRAADRTDDLGAYLARADMDRMIADVRDAARRNPALVVGGAVIAGLAIGRLLRAGAATQTTAVSR